MKQKIEEIHIEEFLIAADVNQVARHTENTPYKARIRAFEFAKHDVSALHFVFRQHFEFFHDGDVALAVNGLHGVRRKEIGFKCQKTHDACGER